jgi:SAM-dependent methyltransferase
MSHYSSEFYSDRSGTLRSAELIVPMVQELIGPKSVVDIGCGLGEFLSVFYSNGVSDILGIDGPWVDTQSLKIAVSHFQTANLEESLSLNRKFDVVISSEVAEHLPESKADTFVNSLTGLGEVILFSAAVPLQGGTMHINEQWPQYWAEIFKQYDFLAIDYLRPRIWNNPEIKYWYKQNMVLYIQKEVLKRYPLLVKYAVDPPGLLPLVHPVIFTYYASSFRRITGMVPKPLKKLFRPFFK